MFRSSQSLSIENLNSEINGTTDLSQIKNSDAIIITAGIARKPGMSRDDLIETNFSIMSEIGEAIEKIFTNVIRYMYNEPIGCHGLVIIKNFRIKKNMVVGMAGILDTARFKLFYRMK